MDTLYSIANNDSLDPRPHSPLDADGLRRLFLDLMLGSPYSPYYPDLKPIVGAFLPKPPLILLDFAISKAARLAHASSPSKLPPRRKSPADDYGADSVFRLALLDQGPARGRPPRLFKLSALRPALADLLSVDLRRHEMALKRRRLIQKQLALHVSRFWKTAHMLANRRARHRTLEQKAELQAKKQRAWIRRAQQYTQAVWDRIEEAEQEEEDRELDEEMAAPCECSDSECPCELAGECSCDRDACKCSRPICRISEAELLKREAEEDLSQLAERLKKEPSAPRSRGRLKRRRLVLEAMRERQMKTASSSSDSEADAALPVKQEPSAAHSPPSTPPVAPAAAEPLATVSECEPAVVGEVEEGKAEAPAEGAAKRLTSQEVSSLLRAELRSYQLEGFEWLRKLHGGGVAGILADEMGLGKTIQTIALLSHLASEEGVWGPHLIIVPTTLVFNWEAEFQKFAPGLKVVSYTGTKKDREQKRKGWVSRFGMSVCVTSYTMAIQDAQFLKRVSWYYMILDEAQNLKNSSTSRWQTLLSYNSVNRLLLTGTPLQNNLMELWSLMYFIIPEIFGKHTDWQTLFSDPVKNAIEKSGATVAKELSVIQDLYQILRPFLLRRLKRDVEAQLPRKREFVIKCFLTRKQKRLYDEVIAAHEDADDRRPAAETPKNPYLKAMNLLMMLKKICNHPHLVHDADSNSEILTSLYVSQSLVRDWYFCEDPATPRDQTAPPLAAALADPTSILRNLITLRSIQFSQTAHSTPSSLPGTASPIYDKHFTPRRLTGPPEYLWSCKDPDTRRSDFCKARRRLKNKTADWLELESLLVSDPYLGLLREKDEAEALGRQRFRASIALAYQAARNSAFERFAEEPVLWNGGSGLREETVVFLQHELSRGATRFETAELLATTRPSFETLFPAERRTLGSRFRCCVPGRVRPVSQRRVVQFSGGPDPLLEASASLGGCPGEVYEWLVSSRVSLPSVLDIEFESGKMRELRAIVTGVVARGEKCVIFTQMTGMLDILERWLMCVLKLNYVRIDGRLRLDRRKTLINQFNHPKSNIVCLITTTRVCGIGVNLTSANNIVFYDTDWNPAMDRQAMDRCHRIGQIKDVNVYRLITYATIEENIWRKQLHKRILDQLVVDQGHFTQVNYQQAFKPADTTELIFTVNSTEDLYATRELHDPTPADGLLPNTAAQPVDDGTWLAEVEDAEDREALAQSKGEMGDTFKLQSAEFSGEPEAADGGGGGGGVGGGGLDELASAASAGAVRLYVDPNVGELMVSAGMSRAVEFVEKEFC